MLDKLTPEQKKCLMYVLLALGLYFALVPHSFHEQHLPHALAAMPHSTHQIIGAVSLVAAWYLYNGEKFMMTAKTAVDSPAVPVTH